MSARRIAAIDDDPAILALFEKMLRPPEFEVLTFTDVGLALEALSAAHPDLIVANILMSETDGWTLLKAVRQSGGLKDVPFIFVSGVASADEILAGYELGADDFVRKPLDPQLFVAKVRALLRLAGRAEAAVEQPGHRLSGRVGEAGTLPIVKYCEDISLTGRLTVEAADTRIWGKFIKGQLIEVGQAPERPGSDPTDALLSLHSGSYFIEQNGLDAGDLEARKTRSGLQLPKAAPSAEGDALQIPAGRLGKVQVGPKEFQVQTEAENRPNFTVTTVVLTLGKVVRKVENRWPHSLRRIEDVSAARLQIDRQHDRVVGLLRERASRASRAAASGAPGQAPGRELLARALNVVVDEAGAQLGSVLALVWLRRTYATLAAEQPALHAFQVVGSQKPRVNADPGPASADDIRAAATWTAAFLVEADEIIEAEGRVHLHEAHAGLSDSLDDAGFYTEFDRAYAALSPSGSARSVPATARAAPTTAASSLRSP